MGKTIRAEKTRETKDLKTSNKKKQKKDTNIRKNRPYDDAFFDQYYS